MGIEAIPRRIRTDCGTENCVLAAIQCYFRRKHTDKFAGDKAHIYGSSHSNQRIKAWWSYLKRNWSSFIINFFTEMVKSSECNPDDKLEKECAKFCFTEVIKNELNRFKSELNTPYIGNLSSARSMAAPRALLLRKSII